MQNEQKPKQRIKSPRRSCFIYATKRDLQEMEERIMALLDDVIADVQEETTVIESVVTLLTSLSAQLAAAGTDPVKLAALKTQIDANKKALSDAVVANTSPPVQQ